MVTKDLKILIPKFLARLELDGYSEEVKKTNKWILAHFEKYCITNQVIEISMNVMEIFIKEKYDINLYETITACQTILRRPLLTFWEYSSTGTYMKSHLFEKSEVPEEFYKFYLKYYAFVNSLGLALSTKVRKLMFVKQLLSYLKEIGIREICNLTKEHIYTYQSKENGHSDSTKKIELYVFIEALDWMHTQRIIEFSGKETFPIVNSGKRRFIPSCYTTDEVKRILESVETNTITGKRDYFILSTLVYYGLRIGDILELKFDNIDWSNNNIHIIQGKTGKPLTLPLIDTVKYPLIDYLKNARYSSDDNHILITLCAPYTCYKNQSFQRIIMKYMDKAGVDYSNKHHGTHVLRHSLASGLLNENVPISAISGILGHNSINTTDLYLTIDEKNLKELSLEVPDVSDSNL